MRAMIKLLEVTYLRRHDRHVVMPLAEFLWPSME